MKTIITQIIKLFLVVTVSSLTLTLVGCASKSANNNTLMTKPPHVVGEALMHASRKAEPSFHFKVKIIPGSAYGLCMPELKAPMTKARCQMLYQAMVKTLNTQPGFADVTVKMLVDPNVFSRIEAAYEQAWFMQV